MLFRSPLLLCSSASLLLSSSPPLLLCSSAHLLLCSSAPLLLSSPPPLLRCVSAPLIISSSAPLLLCSSASLLLSSSPPLLLCTSAPLLLCSSAPLLLLSSSPPLELTCLGDGCCQLRRLRRKRNDHVILPLEGGQQVRENFTKGVDLTPSGTVDITLKSTVAAYQGGSGSPMPNP